MKKRFITFLCAIMLLSLSFSQSIGYYNGTENLKGEALKIALHEIIKAHRDYAYDDAKYILQYADEDPDNPDNMIQLYSNRSVSKSSWGSGGDASNREHVWAASHGGFRDVNPMDGDAHNLHTADASVNLTRSNFDFDNVDGGLYLEEADAYYSSSQQVFEPADRDKGVIARTLFYMAVRYEGTDGEIDLEVVNKTATSPQPEHGKLSTLLEWNRLHPPTDFERRRNQRVFEYQGNRNPFIDNPEFADLIWGGAELSGIAVSDVSCLPASPQRGKEVEVSAKISGANSVKLLWGNSYATASHEVVGETSDFSVKFTPTPNHNDMVHVLIVASNAHVSDTLYATLSFPPDDMGIKPIPEVHGTGNSSPLTGQQVSLAGTVTADMGNQFFIQSSQDVRSGILIYGEALKGNVGDSIIVSGEVTEYNGLTEIKNVTYQYRIGKAVSIPPLELSISDLGEDYEGMFVMLRGVTFKESGKFATESTYTIKQGVHSISMYLGYSSALLKKDIPSGAIDLACIVSQYGSNYQFVMQDMSWVNYEAPSALNEPEEVVKLDMYPQPVNRGQLFIQSEKSIKELAMYAADGCLLRTESALNKNSFELDMSGLSAGVYLIKFDFGNETVVRKVIVE